MKNSILLKKFNLTSDDLKFASSSGLKKLLSFDLENGTYSIKPSLKNLKMKLMLLTASEIRERYGFYRISGKNYNFELPVEFWLILEPFEEFSFTLRIRALLFKVSMDSEGIHASQNDFYDEDLDTFGELIDMEEVFTYGLDSKEIGELTW